MAKIPKISCSYRLDPDTHACIKIMAKIENKSDAEIIAEAVEMYTKAKVAENEKAKKERANILTKIESWLK